MRSYTEISQGHMNYVETRGYRREKVSNGNEVSRTKQGRLLYDSTERSTANGKAGKAGKTGQRRQSFSTWHGGHDAVDGKAVGERSCTHGGRGRQALRRNVGAFLAELNVPTRRGGRGGRYVTPGWVRRRGRGRDRGVGGSGGGGVTVVGVLDEAGRDGGGRDCLNIGPDGEGGEGHHVASGEDAVLWADGALLHVVGGHVVHGMG
ncbi:hypothetical protein FA95DRAFT_296122 [Auriscalpium vulgare]|uniref:Uncharacterized protein n=1 Tax=Auriscalpium vulgare TaxID=40419 RepID=A0ACB8RJ06_9AGAM|nr:hypothetical protein FA95DRAFT_296122 [Auriscalpium vulgare]